MDCTLQIWGSAATVFSTLIAMLANPKILRNQIHDHGLEIEFRKKTLDCGVGDARLGSRQPYDNVGTKSMIPPSSLCCWQYLCSDNSNGILKTVKWKIWAPRIQSCHNDILPAGYCKISYLRAIVPAFYRPWASKPWLYGPLAEICSH